MNQREGERNILCYIMDWVGIAREKRNTTVDKRREIGEKRVVLCVSSKRSYAQLSTYALFTVWHKESREIIKRKRRRKHNCSELWRNGVRGTGHRVTVACCSMANTVVLPKSKPNIKREMKI